MSRAVSSIRVWGNFQNTKNSRVLKYLLQIPWRRNPCRLSNPAFLDRAGRWFLNSGIQDPTGGVARYYRSDIERNTPISTEITGYAVSTLVFLHGRTGDPAYLERAVLAGDFRAQKAWDDERDCFPFEYG